MTGASLLSFRRKSGKAWEHKSRGVIWRVIPTQSKMLVGEERDLENKVVSFFCLDQMNGSPRWVGMQMEEKWWTGIEAVVQDVVLIHGFAKPDMPEHKGLVALDIETGKRLWENPGVTFAYASGESLVVSQKTLTGGETLELQYRSGNVLTGTATPGTIQEPHLPEMPVSLQQIAADHPDVVVAIRTYIGGDPLAAPVDVLLHDDRIILTRLVQSDPGYKNVLSMLSGNGDKIFEEVLDSEARGFVPDAFFVEHGLLYFVKDRRTLIAINLSKYE